MQEVAPMPTITENIVKFKETKNPFYLAKAIYLVLRRGRTHELLYGIYCQWAHAPAQVHPSAEIDEILQHFEQNKVIYKREFLSQQQLRELYGDRFAVDQLPEVFAGTRAESIIETEDSLIIGEYGMDDNSARLATVTKDECFINDYYMHQSGIRHIHSLHAYDDNNNILVATGDRLKVLDLWHQNGSDLTYTKRLKRFLAGYTAMANIQGNFYFGTDFSARPNYIEMQDGKKFFFPEPAYKRFVMSFHIHKDRYLLSLNSNLDDLGGRKTLSIFDTETKQFIYCEEVDLPE